MNALPKYIDSPDYALKETDTSDILHLIKGYDQKTSIDAVIKLSDRSDRVNSIVTAIRVRDRGIKTLMKKCTTIYKPDDL